MSENLIISCPCNNVEERRYIIDVLFGRFLDVEYSLSFDSDADVYVISKGGKKLIVEDHFFSHFPKPLSYLTLQSIPCSLSWFDNDYFPKKIPIIYGFNKLIYSSDSIICGLDIFASSFFMLSRWEEYVLGRNDKGKCDEELLFCVKHAIYQRPIVNEYVELLTSLLLSLDCSVHVNSEFSIKITHDVDRVYLSGWREMLRNVFRLLSKGMMRKSWALLTDYSWYKFFMPHPFNTFGLFMDLSERYGFKDEFYFKACKTGENGYTYSCEEQVVMGHLKEIISRGHIIGYHPSETTFKNKSQFELEVRRLKKVIFNVENGRNHGLYFNIETYRNWMAFAFDIVSNYGFQKRFGFRCGTCFTFPIFDIYKQKTLSIIECPFIFMDTVLLRTMPDAETVFNEILLIINVIKYYKGIVCINWHTNVYNMRKMMKYKNLYERILAYVRKQMD